MGAGLAKNKLSPEPNKRTPRGVISVAPPPTQQSSSKFDRDAPEDEFLEKIANNYMKRDRKSFHQGGTTYAGVDLRLEVDCVDNPASIMEEHSDESYEEDEDAQSETSEFDDGYYTTAEKVLYEKPKPKPDSTPFIVNWKKGTLLGSGGFGKVYLGLDNETGAMFAVKEISLGGDVYNQSKELKGFKQEVAVMKNLRHENIVQYLGTMEEGNELNIFLEYVPGGSIAFILSKFGSFSEPLVKRYTRQILLGLEYLHSHHIIHRDIKGANILVDNCGVVKLADFGASKKMEALMTTTGGYQSLKGTPYWMAPEVIRQSGYGRQADIWSVGCTVIEMATGKPPFHEFTDQVSVLFHIASSNSPPPIPSHLSPVAQDFLLKCFERNPMNRPNARGLLDHPFLKEDNRKLSGNNSGFSSPKANHSFSSPRNKDTPLQPVQFAKQTTDEPRQQHVHSRSNTPQPVQQQPSPLALQPDDDNMMEEPTWTWGGDKRKINFADKFSAELPSFNLNSKRGESFTSQQQQMQIQQQQQQIHQQQMQIQQLQQPNGRHIGDSISEVTNDFRRHKRAISVTPEKMMPSSPLPLDANAPPPARLSMRRHSALESSLRDASDYVKKEGLVPNGSSSQHSNGLCSSPSTPGRLRGAPDEHNLFNNNMANFNNSFNQTFNSINNTNIAGSNHNHNNSGGNLRVSSSSISNNNNISSSPAGGRKFSPITPRREVLDEEDINQFLQSTSNELLQSSKDLSKFTEKKRRDLTLEKLPEHQRKQPPQISPKKFSDAMADGGFSEEAPTNAKFKKKTPGTTTTTIVLNANAINSSASNSSGSLNSSSSSITNGTGSNLSGFKERDRDRDSTNLSGGVNKSGGIVRNAW